MTRRRWIGNALLFAAGVLLATASGAQQQPKAAKAAGKRGVPSAQIGARAACDRDPQGASSARLAAAQIDVVHGGRFLREPEPPRAAARLHDQVGSHAAAARQAQGREPRRRSGVRVLLRREGDDGVRAGREPGRGRRRAADDRCRAGGRQRFRGDLLSVHRRDRRRSVQGHRGRVEDRVLHRPVERSSAARRPTWSRTSTGDVFVQIWIGAEDKLPRRVYAVYLNDRARLRHVLELSNWQLDAAVPADAFASAKAAGAARMAFARPDAKDAPGMKPPPKAKLPRSRRPSRRHEDNDR